MDARRHSWCGLNDVPFSLPTLGSSLSKELDTTRGSNEHKVLAKVQIGSPIRQNQFITALNSFRSDELRFLFRRSL